MVTQIGDKVDLEKHSLPFSGISCDEKSMRCKAWWLATIKNKTVTVEVSWSEPSIMAIRTGQAEREAQELLNDSEAKITGARLWE